MNKPSILHAAVWKLRKAAWMRSKPLTWGEKRELFESFNRMVRKHLPEADWKYGRSQFTKLSGQCERIFFASITDQELELWVDVAVGIRFTDVEEIWRQSQKLDQFTSHWTIEGVVSNYIRNAQLWYQIDRPIDIEFFEPKICGLIEQACIPFWNRFASVADVDREWNHRPFEFDHDATNALHHATRSLIVAKLAKNPKFEELVPMRRGEVTRLLDINLQQKGLEAFDRLVEWLRKEPIPVELI